MEVVIQAGQCLSSVAFEHGFTWQMLWDDPKNQQLKDLRKDPFTLCPGDVVNIPDKQSEGVKRATGARHTFVRKGIPEKLRLQFMDPSNKPRANQPYKLDVDGNVRNGTTDGQGKLQDAIPPTAHKAIVQFEDGAVFSLDLGHLDPIVTIKGVQQRLRNLGYYHDIMDGNIRESFEEAVFAFRTRLGLTPDSEVDDEMRTALQDAYGG